MSAICFNSELCFYATGKGKDKVSNKNTTNFRLKVTFFLYIEILMTYSILGYYIGKPNSILEMLFCSTI